MIPFGLRPFNKPDLARPYAALASFYDDLMDHVEYQIWADYLELLFKKGGKRVRFILDSGCGTGVLLSELSKRQYHITGFDQSLEMVKIAKRRRNQKICCANLIQLPFSKGFDAVLCLFDTVHYLKCDQIESFFLETSRVLSSGGLFIFDVVTEQHVLEYWADYTDIIKEKNWELVRRSWYDRGKKIQYTEFEIFFVTKKKRVKEKHVQQIYPLKVMQKIIAQTGFQTIGVFSEMTLDPGSEASDRVHYVLRRIKS